MTIITVTLNPALDIWATTAALEPDRKLHCTDTELTPGGGGINVARAVRRLGGDSIAIFPAGGSAGAILCDLLRAEDVSIRPVSIAAMTRQSFAIRVATSGQHYRFVLSGPTLNGHDLEACRRQLETGVDEGSIVVLSGSMPDGVGGDELTALIALGHFARSLAGAGADVAMMTSALLRRGPEHVSRVEAELLAWAAEHEYESVDQLRGSVSHVNTADPAAFERANYERTLHSWVAPVPPTRLRRRAV